MSGERLAATYVLPIRWEEDEGLGELSAYLRWVAERMELVVVDGSPPAAFERHASAWGSFAKHVPPDSELRFAYRKVNGVVTGLATAGHDRVILADDDVRYGEAELRRMASLLDEADCVAPQNFFDPAPWHARWDTARSLLNRAIGGDYPGTLGVRRSRLPGGRYDGDVLFENLELMRTVEAAGGTVARPLDLFVRRLPPSAGHFWSQRVRQAYDDFALPARMALWLALGPAVVLMLARRRWGVLVGAGVASMAVAELGRVRAGGTRVFPAGASAFAPAWLLERAVTSWLAVWSRLRHGGVRYGDMLIARAATPPGELRKRFGTAP